MFLVWIAPTTLFFLLILLIFLERFLFIFTIDLIIFLYFCLGLAPTQKVLPYLKNDSAA
jgi:hypothetical protein